jgi:FMN phosphatase YigB (HAD superfamily)
MPTNDIKIKAVLFDLNETLLHQVRTEQSHIAYTYAALTAHYWHITYEAFEAAWKAVHSRQSQKFKEGYRLLLADVNNPAAHEKLHEPWYRENIAAMLHELNCPVNSRLVEKLTWAFQDSWIGGLSLREVDGAGTKITLNALNNLRQKGYKLGIVTNFQQPDLIPEILDIFELSSFFDAVTISATTGRRKPHPDIFAAALKELPGDFQPAETAYIGDSPDDDMAGARFARMHPVLFDANRQHSDYPETRIESLSELPVALERLAAGAKTQ